MASAFTHPVVVLGLYAALRSPRPAARVLAAGLVLSVLPDADVVGFHLGVAYADMLGHRGLTHSLPFALAIALALTPLLVREPDQRLRAGLFLFACAASHGLLDMLTDGGLGIALFAPFSDARWFFPWRPLAVSPIGVGAFFSEWGLRVMASEMLWVWLPVTLLAAPLALWRRRRR